MTIKKLAEPLDSDVTLALAAPDPVAVRAYPALPAPQRFDATTLALSEQFGEPDWPGTDFDWPAALGVSGRQHVAVWDFDHYQLSLWVDGPSVLLRRHRSAEPPS